MQCWVQAMYFWGRLPEFVEQEMGPPVNMSLRLWDNVNTLTEYGHSLYSILDSEQKTELKYLLMTRGKSLTAESPAVYHCVDSSEQIAQQLELSRKALPLSHRLAAENYRALPLQRTVREAIDYTGVYLRNEKLHIGQGKSLEFCWLARVYDVYPQPQLVYKTQSQLARLANELGLKVAPFQTFSEAVYSCLNPRLFANQGAQSPRTQQRRAIWAILKEAAMIEENLLENMGK